MNARIQQCSRRRAYESETERPWIRFPTSPWKHPGHDNGNCEHQQPADESAVEIGPQRRADGEYPEKTAISGPPVLPEQLRPCEREQHAEQLCSCRPHVEREPRAGYSKQQREQKGYTPSPQRGEEQRQCEADKERSQRHDAVETAQTQRKPVHSPGRAIRSIW